MKLGEVVEEPGPRVHLDKQVDEFDAWHQLGYVAAEPFENRVRFVAVLAT